MSSSQLATLAVEVEVLLAEEAKGRQEATQLVGPGIQKQTAYGQGINSLTIEEKGQARDQAANLFGTNGRYGSY